MFSTAQKSEDYTCTGCRTPAEEPNINGSGAQVKTQQAAHRSGQQSLLKDNVNLIMSQ